VITSLKTSTSSSSPNTSTRRSRSPFQDLGKDLESNVVDISPNTNQGGEVLHNHDILVLDNQESIVAEVLGTQIEGEVDTLVEL
jgi:hypothetical protein